jgi:hypothetical protein
MNKAVLWAFAALLVLAFIVLCIALEAFITGSFTKALRAWAALAVLTTIATLLAVYLRKEK